MKFKKQYFHHFFEGFDLTIFLYIPLILTWSSSKDLVRNVKENGQVRSKTLEKMMKNIFFKISFRQIQRKCYQVSVCQFWCSGDKSNRGSFWATPEISLYLNHNRKSRSRTAYYECFVLLKLDRHQNSANHRGSLMIFCFYSTHHSTF